ncbi:hypothetical protein LZZ90_02105 [Flavobacterium sp. SM15]|uniref:hypothetical protein n=1 Tax=Flavobacterium sp. SM15 TaxID=2908005 RepID=UPI001EDB899F|nr:hypothetical protein [Flavobacterium sp. SM15]MCG2610297.1 hypothetical protein [Flavobacterium sp. SM15]
MLKKRESIFNLEFDSPWVKYFFFAFVLGLGFFILAHDIYKQSNYDYKGEFYKEHIKDEVNAKVQYKIDNEWHRDKLGKNHFDRAVLRLSDSSEIGYYSIYFKVNVGDSLIKEKNSKTIKIIKKDTIIYNDIYDENKFHYELRYVSKNERTILFLHTESSRPNL